MQIHVKRVSACARNVVIPVDDSFSNPSLSQLRSKEYAALNLIGNDCISLFIIFIYDLSVLTGFT